MGSFLRGKALCESVHPLRCSWGGRGPLNDGGVETFEVEKRLRAVHQLAFLEVKALELAV